MWQLGGADVRELSSKAPIKTKRRWAHSLDLSAIGNAPNPRKQLHEVRTNVFNALAGRSYTAPGRLRQYTEAEGWRGDRRR
jgi:hypothetical protein